VSCTQSPEDVYWQQVNPKVTSKTISEGIFGNGAYVFITDGQEGCHYSCSLLIDSFAGLFLPSVIVTEDFTNFTSQELNLTQYFSWFDPSIAFGDAGFVVGSDP
jgi:hypothetical protein